MHPGVACIACHVTTGGEAPNFAIAGTAYPTGHEYDDCSAAPRARAGERHRRTTTSRGPSASTGRETSTATPPAAGRCSPSARRSPSTAGRARCPAQSTAVTATPVTRSWATRAHRAASRCPERGERRRRERRARRQAPGPAFHRFGSGRPRPAPSRGELRPDLVAQRAGDVPAFTAPDPLCSKMHASTAWRPALPLCSSRAPQPQRRGGAGLPAPRAAPRRVPAEDRDQVHRAARALATAGERRAPPRAFARLIRPPVARAATAPPAGARCARAAAGGGERRPRRRTSTQPAPAEPAPSPSTRATSRAGRHPDRGGQAAAHGDAGHHLGDDERHRCRLEPLDRAGHQRPELVAHRRRDARAAAGCARR